MGKNRGGYVAEGREAEQVIVKAAMLRDGRDYCMLLCGEWAVGRGALA